MLRSFLAFSLVILVVSAGRADADDISQAWQQLVRHSQVARQAREEAQQESVQQGRITLGNWHCVGPFRTAAHGIITESFATEFPPEQQVLAAGRELIELSRTWETKKFPGMRDTTRRWVEHPEWIDGYRHPLPIGPPPSRNETVYLYRTITAERACSVLAEVLAESYTRVWLNGRPIAEHRIASRSSIVRHWHMTLDLLPGENRLLIKNTSEYSAHTLAFSIPHLTPSFAQYEKLSAHDKDVGRYMLSTAERFHPYNWPFALPGVSRPQRPWHETLTAARQPLAALQQDPIPWPRLLQDFCDPTSRYEIRREQEDAIWKDYWHSGKVTDLLNAYIRAISERLGLSDDQVREHLSSTTVDVEVQFVRDLYHRTIRYQDALARVGQFKFDVTRIPMYDPPQLEIDEALAAQVAPSAGGRAYVEKLQSLKPLAEQALGNKPEAIVDVARQIDRAMSEEIVSLGPIVFIRCPAFETNAIAPFSAEGAAPASICVFDPSQPTKQPRVIFHEPETVLYDMNLSYDAKTVFFSAKRPGVEGGWHIYEIGVDGKNLRQITDGPADDISPVLLPSGELIFVSTRANTWVQCQGYQASLLYACDRDGGNVRKLSANIDSDHSPQVLNDGRVLFTRWDYGVEKNVFARHALWTMNPDGSRMQLFFGNTIEDPAAFWEARPIPGRPEVLSTFGPHHSYHAGMIGLVWDHLGVEAPRGKGFRWITQELPSYHDLTFPHGYQDAFPINERLFLVSYGGDGHKRNRLYLLDDRGNRKCIFEDEQLGCWAPMLLAARKTPPVIIPQADNPEYVYRDPVEVNRKPDDLWGTFLLSDVYQGISDYVEPGEAKYLQIMEQVQKSRRMASGEAWGHTPIIGRGTVHVRRLVGIVPIEPDGSAHFKAPALRNISFNLLDADGKLLMRMGSDMHVMPGEVTGCVGCHPKSRQLAADAKRPLSAPVMPRKPDWGTDGLIDFVKVVQPVLDKYCVECHAGPTPDGAVDLSNDKTRFFNMAYDNLIDRGLVYHLNVFAYGHNQNTPKTIGSFVSPIAKYLDTSEHSGHEIPWDDRLRVYTWIDANVPYYGTYTYTKVRGIGARDSWDGGNPDGWLRKDLVPVFKRRCFDCHKRTVYNPAWYTPGAAVVTSKVWTPQGITAHGFPARYPMSGLVGPEFRLNLTHPEYSQLLTAPLAEEAGGMGLCRNEQGQPFVFKDASDPDYRTMLGALRQGAEQLKANPRMDMPEGYAALANYVPPDTSWRQRGLMRVPLHPAPVIEKTENVTVLSDLPKGLTNLALGAEATSQDDVPIEKPSDPPSNAIDGNVDTYWDDQDRGGELYNLTLKFPEPVAISALAITGWQHHDFSPKDFVILCDGKPVATVKDAQYTANRLILAITRQTCRTVALNIAASHGGSPGIRELEVYDLQQ